MAEAYSPGVAAEMPQAAQTVDRFHVTRVFPGATDRVRCRGRRESEEKRAMLAGTKCVRLKREPNLTERKLAKRRGLDPARSHLRTARACQMAEAMRDACELPDRESAAGALDRLCAWTAHSNVPEIGWSRGRSARSGRASSTGGGGARRTPSFRASTP